MKKLRTIVLRIDMNNTKQVNEEYRFRISYIGEYLKDLFSTSSELERTNLDKRIKEIEAQEDAKHIEGLEEDINTFIEKKVTKAKGTTFNTKNVKGKSKQKEDDKQIYRDIEEESR